MMRHELALALVLRRACASAVEPMETVWSAAAAVVSEGSEGESKKWNCGAGRLTGTRCGLCWCALARHGLSRQDAGDAWRHAALEV